MSRITCGICKKEIDDGEFLSVTLPSEHDENIREGKIICKECAEKYYPDLYPYFFSTTIKDNPQ